MGQDVRVISVDDDIAQGIIRVAESGGDGDGAEVFGGCDVIAMTTPGVQRTAALSGKRDRTRTRYLAFAAAVRST